MTLFKNQRGFSPLIVVAVVVVLAALGGAGYYVWSKNQDDKDKKPTTSQNKDDDSKDETPADPSEGGKYLVIKEWGVRFELPEDLRGDVEYGVFTFNNGNQTMYFASKQLVAKSTYAGCNSLKAADESFGSGIRGGNVSLSRQKDMPENKIEGLDFMYGDYWYHLDFSNGGACYEGDTGQEAGAFKSEMDAAIKTLESIE